MVYRIAGGLFLLLTGLVALGLSIPVVIIGLCALVGGLALLAGF